MNPRAFLMEELRRNRDEILTLVQDLVRIPSENPPGDTTEISGYIAAYLDKHGLDYDVISPEPTAPNIVSTFDGGEPGQHLVLNGHIDCYPAGDRSQWSADPFSGQVMKGNLFGRGVADMKVGTAASILTFIYLSRIRQQIHGKLTLAVVSDEMTFGPWGARYLIENCPKVLGDCVLNGEPSTPYSVRVGEKGFLWLEAEVIAKGGHGGYPQLEGNAITNTAKLITELDELGSIYGDMPLEILELIEEARETTDEQLGPQATDTLLKVTVNVGLIQGGLKLNMAAPYCRTTLDIRCPVGVSTAVVLQRFEEVLSRITGSSYRVINRSEANYCDPNHQMVRLIQKNSDEVRGVRPTPNVGLGGTDARLWRLRGIPAFVYGPTPNNMGSPDEHVSLDDLFGTVGVHVLSSLDYLTATNLDV